MADPFFTQGADDDDDDEIVPQISYNQYQKNEKQHVQDKYSHNQQNKKQGKDSYKKQHNEPKPQTKTSYKFDKSSSHSQEKKPRLPSMLDDVQAPKPLHINPLKPPGSKLLFDVQMPDTITYAQPYD